jgi:hypothetical protein
MLADKVRAASSAEKLFTDDVFSTWLYDGNGSTQTITNGIDLAGKGGLVWIKNRAAANDHALWDTVANTQLRSNVTNAGSGGSNFSATASGFTLNTSVSDINATGNNTYNSWTFRRAAKFFDVQTISHTNGVATNITLTDLATVGMVIAKRTNTTGDWTTWHRSLTAGNNLRLNTTAAQTTTDAWLSVSGTTATLASTAPTGTYVIYAWAHDTASDGMIQCGSYTGNGSGTGPVINLGWEPQYILVKRSAGGTGNWVILDSTRGIASRDPMLQANTTAAEDATQDVLADLSATGFQPNTTLSDINTLSSTYIYLAIRRPNKPPTSGTQVFQPTVYTGTNVDYRLVNTGILTDMVWARQRNDAALAGMVVGDRLRGQPYLLTGSTAAQVNDADSFDQQFVGSVEYGTAFSSMNGFWCGNDPTSKLNANTTANNHIVEAFRRAPGFFEQINVSKSVIPQTFDHNLGSVPELVIVKATGSGSWFVAHSGFSGGITAGFCHLSTTAAFVSASNVVTAVTSTTLSLGGGIVNSSLVAYLFASLPGISKVGSYTGNGGTVNTDGTAQTIDCGFTTGARFVLIKRTDSTGDWFVFDTARGIVAAEDPYLLTNSTAAEVTSVDAVDTDNSGFIVNQTSGTNLNVTSATYIYLAIA